MKNTVKIVVLICLIACMLLSTVACNITIPPFEAGTSGESTGEQTTPEGENSDDLYKLEMQTVFEIAKEAGYKGTLEELVAMFKGERGPAGTDGVTPHIGENGNWWVGDTDLGVSAKGIQGPQGEQGVQGPQGEQGKPGEPGREIAKMEMVNGELIVYYTDGTSQNLGPIGNGTPEVENMSYIVKVADTNGNPIAGVELQLCFDGKYIPLPATAENGYTFSQAIAPMDYTVVVVRADGYEFDAGFEYPFVSGSNVAYISLAPETVVTPPTGDDEIEMPEKIDMEGYTYRAYVRDFAGTVPNEHTAQVQNGNNDYRCIDFWMDEANSMNDIISYSVYNRNQQIETDYNCKIRQASSNGSQLEHLIVAFTNGTGYDLTIITARPAAQAATQNLLQNLKASQYMDLSNPAFDQNSVKDLSVGDKLYFLSGDMNISTMEVAGATVVNMEFYEDLVDTIVEEFDGDESYCNIYNVVLAKKWTMETMLKIAKLANIDIDTSDGALHVLPNGVVNGVEVEDKYHGGDVVGYHQYLYSTLWYFYGSGGRITARNEDGLPELVIQNNLGQTLYDYIFDKFNLKINAPWIPHESSHILNMNFLTGDVLFADTSFFNIRTEIFNYAEFEYGILPIPVYEEGMDYQSVVYFNNWAHLWAIPTLTSNNEYAERMMQIMAVYSSLPDSTMNAYYQRTIFLLAAKDNRSREVMDMIKDSLVYDMALLYPSWGSIEERLYFIANADSPEYAGIVEYVSLIEEIMNETIRQLLNPEGGY